MNESLYRYTAFATVPTGGNPAGIWIGDALPPDAEMQRIATGLAYPETIFVSPAAGFERRVRYFSPVKEVDFCGHATIATGVLFGQQRGGRRIPLHDQHRRRARLGAGTPGALGGGADIRRAAARAGIGAALACRARGAGVARG